MDWTWECFLFSNGLNHALTVSSKLPWDSTVQDGLLGEQDQFLQMLWALPWRANAYFALITLKFLIVVEQGIHGVRQLLMLAHLVAAAGFSWASFSMSPPILQGSPRFLSMMTELFQESGNKVPEDLSQNFYTIVFAALLSLPGQPSDKEGEIWIPFLARQEKPFAKGNLKTDGQSLWPLIAIYYRRGTHFWRKKIISVRDVL